MMWRSCRRTVGYWIAGEQPTEVHCIHCARITTAWCTAHRDAHSRQTLANHQALIRDTMQTTSRIQRVKS